MVMPYNVTDILANILLQEAIKIVINIIFSYNLNLKLLKIF